MAGHIHLAAVIGALLLPSAWSLIFRILALRSKDSQRATDWLQYRRRMRTLVLLAIPTWWSLTGAFTRSGVNRDPILDWPTWILLVAPVGAGIFIGQFVAYWSDGSILGRRWTAADLLRLSFWSTLSSAIPLLIVAVGVDAICNRSLAGVLCIGFAGILALASTLRLQSAEGIIPRVVKSGELYKRAFTMAKRMGVRLERVSVIPFGRGRLTNAYGGSRGIAITDDYGHWLHGAHLDFVIGHELAHVQERHGQRKLLLVAAIFSGVAALTFAASRLSPFWQIPFKFVVVLLPVLAFYYVSRRFEFAADRIAVQSTGDVEAGIGALASTYRRTGVPPRCNSFDELFSTHLALWRRVNAVAAVGRVSPEYVSRVEQQFNDRVNELPTLKASSHSE